VSVCVAVAVSVSINDGVGIVIMIRFNQTRKIIVEAPSTGALNCDEGTCKVSDLSL